MKYDEQILLKGAISLEARASQIVFWTAARYLAITFTVAWLGISGYDLLSHSNEFPQLPVAGICAAIAMLIGVFVGRDHAFDLRLQAQQLFALVQIARNTSKTEAEVLVGK